jgi:uncharacterized membrane protein
MTFASPDSTRANHWFDKKARAVLALVILLLAAVVRIPNLGSAPYVLDELWTAELASGRGSPHLHLPANVALKPPEFFALASAPPWWSVWTHMECTHPPLYFLLLRLWEQIWGDSDFAGRMLSVLASIAALAFFYDVVRFLNGDRVALWAAALMALAQPQIAYARQTRNYALLVLVAMIAVNALVRIERLGFTWRRWFALTASVLATLLTHYFCIGAIAAMAVYATIRLPAPARRKVLLAFIIAGILFVITWGPFMWRQRTLFSTSDETTTFLQNTAANKLELTLSRLLYLPARLFTEPVGSWIQISAVLAALYAVPFLLVRWRPDLLFWGLWLCGTVGAVAIMDIFHQTDQLQFIRYTLLAGPAVYCLVPALSAAIPRPRWVGHAIPAALALLCAATVPNAYSNAAGNPPPITAQLKEKIDSNDLLVFVGSGNTPWAGGANYLEISRYLKPIPCPIMVLHEPASGAALSRAREARNVFVFTFRESGPLFISGTRLVSVMPFSSTGADCLVWQLVPATTQPMK